MTTLTIDFTRKKFGMISLGCDKNRVDSEKLLAIIKDRGCEVVSDPEKVNVLVVNTCAFLNASRKEAVETVIECAAYKSENLEKIVVTGCLPQKYINETFQTKTRGRLIGRAEVPNRKWLFHLFSGRRNRPRHK